MRTLQSLAMAWYFAVAEHLHELQNPTSEPKITLLGERLGLGPGSRVLDMASGKGGPARILARTFGCRITCLERAEEFDAVARERARTEGLEHLLTLVRSDAAEFEIEPGAYDAALCLGASFVWGGLDQTLRALLPGVRPGGFVVVGEPYWRRWPLPEGFELDPDEGQFLPLAQTVDRFESAGLTPVTMIDASLDDWDRYETLHWLAVDAWVRDHPDDPDANEIRDRSARHRKRYLEWERELLGWAIFVGRGP
jgi:SAM-dependent methyltransferase